MCPCKLMFNTPEENSNWKKVMTPIDYSFKYFIFTRATETFRDESFVKNRANSCDYHSASSKGTVILEATIAIPIIFIIMLIILTGIRCVQADIAFTQAVDQATNEAAIAVPVMDAGLDAVSDLVSSIRDSEVMVADETDDTFSGVSKALGFARAVGDYIGIEGEDVIGTVVFGKALRDRIVWTYDRLCMSKLLRDSIDNVSVYLDLNRENKSIDLEIYYEWVTPFMNIQKKMRSSIPIYGDLQLKIETQGNREVEDSLWEKSNFERGLYFRKLYGANLPESFPVLSGWDNGTATSIKSIDLTAPSYQSGDDLDKKIRGHIDELSGYQGTEKPWGKDQIFIEDDSIQNRVLFIIIPENSPDSVRNELDVYRNYAESQGVDLIYKEHGVSSRYQKDEDSSEKTPGEELTD